MNMEHDEKHINLLDTPGYPDFMGRAMSVLPSIETAAVVISAQAGIETITQKMMDAAAARNLCRLIIINKIDAEDVDFSALMDRIKEAYGRECLPINLPTGNGQGVADCFFNLSGSETDFSSVESAHTEIIDQVVEVDEALMEVYLEQGDELKPEQLHNPFEKALREGHLIPVCFTSARTGAGIAELLDIFSHLMPNPAEGNPPPFLKGEGDTAEPIEIQPTPEHHALAHVFKLTVDPFVGRLGVFRIHQGVVNKDSQLFIGDSRKPFKVGHLLKIQGKDHQEIERGVPGDICAVAKVDDLYFDAVLHDSHEDDHIHLKSIECPMPMFGLAIQAKSRSDEQKITDTLQKLDAEDPCFHVEHNAVLNETVIRGLGDLHLRVILEKMQSQYHVEVDTRPPRIAYRETISMKAEGHHRHKKQTGGAGQFGEVFLRIEPLERGAGFEFVNAVVGGVIPSTFILAVEKGVRKVLDTGAIAGYSFHDIRVTVYDGKHHSVDSNEISFITAGKRALLEAIQKAKPLVLEPIVNIKITAPNTKMGDITGDLSSKRGRINGTSTLPNGMVVIDGKVPLSELTNYQSQLKSVTGGEGSYTMELSHYGPVPAKVQQQLMTDFRPREEG